MCDRDPSLGGDRGRRAEVGGDGRVVGDEPYDRSVLLFLRRAIASLPLVLWRVDPDGTITHSMGGGLASLGLEEGEAVGNDVFEHYPQAADDIRAALAGEARTYYTEGQSEHGTWAYETFTMPDPSGTGAFGFSFDISERVELERRARNAQRLEALGHLAAGVAHDFNNIMTIILGATSLLRAEVEGPAEVEVRAIEGAARRAVTLTEQLLAFGRRQRYSPETFAAAEVVAGFEPMLRRTLGPQVDLVLELAPDLNWVRADRTGFEQVLMNLVLNARDAMPGGGRLVVRGRNVTRIGRKGRPEGGVELAVEDSGEGIPAEIQPRIFDPFFTTKDPQKGTGLGLSMIHGILDQAGGEVRFESEVGRGTTFWVTFPVAPADAREDGSNPEASPQSPARRTGTVLLVEDDEGVRLLCRKVLERQGYQVVEASDGVAAFELLDSEPGRFDLVVTDILMPRMNGHELLAGMAARALDLPVVVMSGSADARPLSNELPLEGVVFMAKPFEPEQLVRTVAEVLDDA